MKKVSVLPHKFASKAAAEHKVCEVLSSGRQTLKVAGRACRSRAKAKCASSTPHAMQSAGVVCVNKIDWLTGLLFCNMTAHSCRRKRHTGSERRNSAAAVNAQGRCQNEGQDSHQRWGEGQTPHRGFELVHRWRDALGAVRHQWLDLDFEFFPAVLVVLRVTGGEKLLLSGIQYICVKEKWRAAQRSEKMVSIYTLDSDHSSMMSQRAVVLYSS